MSASTSEAPTYSAPLVFQPQQTHKTTIIMLHGRGGTAERFAEPFLLDAVAPLSNIASKAPSSASEHIKVFRDYFPNTKFVFLTAPLRRAVALNRNPTHQWFDHWSHKEPELKQDLQIPGLRETTAFLHGLLQQEIDIIGAPNVVLMGLSQGCASSIIATLLWVGEPFGALVGMCGYLPFRKGMRDFTINEDNNKRNPSASGKEEADDVLELDEESEQGTRFERSVEWLREELEVPKAGNIRTGPSPMQSTPIFMGHGIEDGLVPCKNGRLAAEFLRDIDVDVEWKEYEGLGHWYSEHMLRDIVKFLKKRKGWKESDSIGGGDINESENQGDREERGAVDTNPTAPPKVGRFADGKFTYNVDFGSRS